MSIRYKILDYLFGEDIGDLVSEIEEYKELKVYEIVKFLLEEFRKLKKDRAQLAKEDRASETD